MGAALLFGVSNARPVEWESCLGAVFHKDRSVCNL